MSEFSEPKITKINEKDVTAPREGKCETCNGSRRIEFGDADQPIIEPCPECTMT